MHDFKVFYHRKERLKSLLSQFTNEGQVDENSKLLDDLQKHNWVRSDYEIGYDLFFETLLHKCLDFKTGIHENQFKMFLNMLMKELKATRQTSLIIRSILPEILKLNMNSDVMRSMFIDQEHSHQHQVQFLTRVDNPMVPNYSSLAQDIRTLDLKMAPDTDPLSLIE